MSSSSKRDVAADGLALVTIGAQGSIQRLRRLLYIQSKLHAINQRDASQLEADFRGALFDVASALIPAISVFPFRPQSESATTPLPPSSSGTVSPPLSPPVSPPRQSNPQTVSALERDLSDHHDEECAALERSLEALYARLLVLQNDCTRAKMTVALIDFQSELAAAKRFNQQLLSHHLPANSYTFRNFFRPKDVAKPVSAQSSDVEQKLAHMHISLEAKERHVRSSITGLGRCGDDAAACGGGVPNARALGMCLHYVRRYLEQVDSIIKKTMAPTPHPRFSGAQLETLFVLRTKIDALVDVLLLTRQVGIGRFVPWRRATLCRCARSCVYLLFGVPSLCRAYLLFGVLSLCCDVL